MAVIYWLAAAAVFVVIEIVTLGLTTVWFAGGALFGALLALLGAPLWLQIAVFVAVSAVLLFLTRPLAKRYLNEKTVRTNADSLIGQACIVTEAIDNLQGKGQVTVRGQEWTARSVSDEERIEKEARVVIERISGVKLIVRREAA